jgi:hypothetical protein
MPSPQSKRYRFSITHSPGHVASIKKFEASHCKYLIYSQRDQRDDGEWSQMRRIGCPCPDGSGCTCCETGPTIEGFFTLKEKLSVTGVRKALWFNNNHRLHRLFLEAAKGSSKDLAASYKEGDYVEFGEPPRQGERTDLRPDIHGVAHVVKPTIHLDMRQYPTIHEYNEAIERARIQPTCGKFQRKRRKLSQKRYSEVSRKDKVSHRAWEAVDKLFEEKD